MSKKPETIFCEKIDRELKKFFGKKIAVFNIQQVTINGTPDRLICLCGQFIALEVKIEEGTPSKIQLLKLAKIKKAGGFSAVVYPSTWQYVLEELKNIYESLK